MVRDPMSRVPPEPDPADDIEILEVVGVDEDGTPIDAEETGEDVEVVFDDAGTDVQETSPSAGDALRPSAEDGALRERLLRLQADFENFKKRIDRDRHDYLRHATGDLVGRILPVLDNFERAVASSRAEGGVDPLLEGVTLIQRQLLEELRKEGLRPMEAVGSAFDPELHEAVATEAGSPAPPNTVTAVLQRGYFFHDRVLRPALVRVSVDRGDGGPAGREES